MRCGTEFSWIDDLAALPDDARALFADPRIGPGVTAITDCHAWYRLLIGSARPEGMTPRFALGRIDGRAVALLPLWRGAGRALQSLGSPYTCLYRPVLAAGLSVATLEALGCALAGLLRPMTALRLEALDADWPPLAPFLCGMGRGGLVALHFAHFGAWHGAIPSGGWPAYLATRSGQLRATIRRRTARLLREPEFRFEMVAGGSGLEDGIAAFEAVYGQSWKNAEPYPDFNADWMRAAAGLGLLRLAILWRAEMPVAVQYWVIADGTAQVLKLAHVAAFDAYSPGTVLTAWAIRQMIDQDGITALDFGRGDDPYKRLWVEQRAQRIGIVLANPRTINGLIIILRHAVGGLRRRIRGLQPAGDASPGSDRTFSVQYEPALL